MDNNDVFSRLKAEAEKYAKEGILGDIIGNIETLLIRIINPDKFQIEGRYKELDSIREKIERKAYTDPSQMTDLIGLNIILMSQEQAEKVCSLVRQHYKVSDIDDYYADKRSDGYEAVHLVCEIVPGISCEIQIKDIRSELKQEFCHSRIYKNKSLPAEKKDDINLEMNKSLDAWLENKELDVRSTFAVSELAGLEGILQKHIDNAEKNSRMKSFKELAAEADRKAESRNQTRLSQNTEKDRVQNKDKNER